MPAKDGQISWGILGTGSAARSFASGLRHVPGAQLGGVGSRTMESARSFARTYGAKRAYVGYERLVADEEIDVVYIATPGDRHRDDCLLSLGAGKAVLCEKPFALDANQAGEVIGLARTKRLFCMEAMWMRFMPLVQRAKRMIDDGAIGTVHALCADFAVASTRCPPGERSDVSRGAMLNRGVYCLSLASYLLGPTESVVSMATTSDAGIDVSSAYLLRFGSGTTAVLWASEKCSGSNEAVVIGSSGKLRLHEPFYRPHRLSLMRVPSRGAGLVRPGIESVGLVARMKEGRFAQGILRRLQPLLRRPAMDLVEPFVGNGYNYEAREVVRCLEANMTESPAMPLDETLRIMELMDRIRAQWAR